LFVSEWLRLPPAAAEPQHSQLRFSSGGYTYKLCNNCHYLYQTPLDDAVCCLWEISREVMFISPEKADLLFRLVPLYRPLEPKAYIRSILSVDKPWPDSWTDTATQEMEFDWVRHMFVCRIVQSKSVIQR
jgi:hypothetical protein